MSGSKLGSAADFQPVIVQSRTTRLDLAASAIRICRNGIEFQSATPFNVWAEMTVSLQTPLDPKRLNCTGVVVKCQGNRHAGYRVSMLFTDLTRQTQARLSALAYSR
ncbi:MAG: PilZ domain-containing protein [Verrucomicrobia bacterium]|nr:PilZ domain-containing protein [Verrucomicrobiota bacterium]